MTKRHPDSPVDGLLEADRTLSAVVAPNPIGMVKLARLTKATSTEMSGLLCSFLFMSAALGAVGLVLTLIRQLLPIFQIVLPLAVAWWFWQRHRRLQTRQQSRLHDVFYRLLQAHHGRITLLDFAMTASIPAIVARQYLDNRAKEFAARFEVTEQGDVVYVFSSLQLARSSSSPRLREEITIKEEPIITDRLHALAQPEAEAWPASLTQVELAKRLGVAAKTVSRKKHLSTLSDWTQTRDPNGVRWSYDVESQRFFPLGDRLSTPSSTQREENGACQQSLTGDQGKSSQ